MITPPTRTICNDITDKSLTAFDVAISHTLGYRIFKIFLGATFLFAQVVKILVFY